MSEVIKAFIEIERVRFFKDDWGISKEVLNWVWTD